MGTRIPRFERLESRFALAVGDLELSFGQGGVVTEAETVNLDSADTIRRVFQDAQERTLTVGSASTGHGTHLAVSRHDSSGHLDLTFADQGLFSSSLGKDYLVVEDAAMDATGAIVVALRGSPDYYLARVQPDGTLDVAFGDEGVVPVESYPQRIALAPNGDIITAGTQSDLVQVVRYGNDGNLVRSFGDLGTVKLSFRRTRSVALLVPDNDTVLIAATAEVQGVEVSARLVRLDGNGIVDSSFGNGQPVTYSVVINDDAYYDEPLKLALTPAGKFLFAATEIIEGSPDEHHFFLVQLNPDGTPDAAFGSEGRVSLRFGGKFGTTLTDLSVASDGSIALSGIVKQSYFQLTVARFRADGTFQRDFGNGGIYEERVLPFVREDGDRGGVLASVDGTTTIGLTQDRDFRLMRFTSDGVPDTSFGSNGSTTTNVFAHLASTTGVAALALANGNILALEYSHFVHPTFHSDYGLRRYWPDGTPDIAYGEDGRLSLSPIGARLTEYAYQAYFVSGENDSFVVLDAYGELGIAKLDEKGEIDPGFGSEGWIQFDYRPWMASILHQIQLWDGRGLLVMGRSNDFTQYVVLNLKLDGTVDESFADHGVLRLDKKAHVAGDGITACFQPDNRFGLLFGNPAEYSTFSTALRVYSASGELDTSFADSGTLRVPLTTGYGNGGRHLVCGADRSWLVTGLYPVVSGVGPLRAVLYKYTQEGLTDMDFGIGGRATLPMEEIYGAISSLRVDESGAMLAGTHAYGATQDFAIVRMNPDASPDHMFGTQGAVQLDLHGYGDTLQTISQAPNGDLIIAGTTKTGTETALALVRLEGQREPGNVWHNGRTPADVNADGEVSALDALIVINKLNTLGPLVLPPYNNPRLYNGFLDVDNDKRVSPIDALIVINRVNAAAAALSEGKSAASAAVLDPDSPATCGSNPWRHRHAIESAYHDVSPHETGSDPAAVRPRRREPGDLPTMLQDLDLWKRLVDAVLVDKAAE